MLGSVQTRIIKKKSVGYRRTCVLFPPTQLRSLSGPFQTYVHESKKERKEMNTAETRRVTGGARACLPVFIFHVLSGPSCGCPKMVPVSWHRHNMGENICTVGAVHRSVARAAISHRCHDDFTRRCAAAAIIVIERQGGINKEGRIVL